MNALIFVTLLALSSVNASVLGLGALGLVAPGAPAVAIQGPSAQAALAGPDGSAIAATAAGGAVATGPTAGGVVTAAVAPGIVAAAPALLAAPTVVAGPSGTVITTGLARAPLILG